MPIILPSQLGETQADKAWWAVVEDVVSRLEVPTPMGMIPIHPFDEWMKVFKSNAAIKLIVGGEGSGKSLHGGLYLTCRAIYDVIFGPQLYWVIGKDFEDARKDLDYFLDLYKQIGEFSYYSVSEKRDQPCVVITDAGHKIVTVSAYDFTKVARDEPFGIVGAEVSRWEEEVLSRCEGRLIRNYPNAWGFFGGSPESSIGWFADTVKFGQGPNDRGIRSFSIPTWCNLAKYPGGREDPAIKIAEAGRSPQKFLERFGAEFVPPKGLVCHTFRYNLHVDHQLEYDPNLPVYIGIDPGGITYAVVMCQFTDEGEIHILDEIYAHRWTHEEVINDLKANPLYPAIAGGSIDVASKQVQNAMPVAYDEWYKDTGIDLWAEKHLVDDSVDRLLWALATNPNTGRPRTTIHPRCTGTISEMGGCASPVPDGGPWMRYSTQHNQWGPPMRKNDHACKGLAYLLQGPYSYVALDRARGRANAVSYLHPSRNTGNSGRSVSYVR